MGKICASELSRLVSLHDKLNRGVYKPTKWEPKYFVTNDDEDVLGTHAEKKKIRGRNYRRRKKHMVKVLRERIEYLQTKEPEVFGLGLKFEPLFDFSLEDEAEILSLDLARMPTESPSDLEPLEITDDIASLFEV